MRTRSRSTTTATGMTTPYEPLPDSCSSELTGEAMPSCARLVATATIGMPAMCAANLVTSMVRPPPIPATASYAPARSRSPSATALPWLPSLIRKISAVADLQFGRDAVTLAGPDRDRHASLGGDAPVGEQVAEAGDRTRPHVDDQRCGEHPGQQRHAQRD